jgi:hypothetical protein
LFSTAIFELFCGIFRCLATVGEGKIIRLGPFGSSKPEFRPSVARWPKFRPKSSQGAGEKLSWTEEFMAEVWPNLLKETEKGPQKIL